MRNLTLRDPSYMGALSVAPPPLGLSLRFADTKSLIDLVSGQNLITFTRASSATYIDSDGVMKVAAVNVPRIDHDPVTGECLGLLIEEQRTNLLIPSENFGTNWGLASATRTLDVGTAPNGTLTADRVESTGGGVFRAGVGVANATAYTYSVFLKHVSGTGIVNSVGFERFGATPLAAQSSFNVQTGVIVSNGASVAASSITAFGNGWYRVTVTAISTDTTATVINYTSTSGNQFLIWGAQLEAGAFPTSYIPTTSSAATRSADVASITGTNFSSWYRQDEGTVFAEARSIASAGSERFPLIIQGATFNDRWVVGVAATNQYQTFYALGGAAQANLTVGSLTDSSVFRLASTAKINDIAMSVNGSAVQLDASASLITASEIRIGQAAQYLNGTIRRIDYWPQRLPDSMLRAITL